MGWMDWIGWDLCVGLFYEHRFAMLIMLFCGNFLKAKRIEVAVGTPAGYKDVVCNSPTSSYLPTKLKVAPNLDIST